MFCENADETCAAGIIVTPRDLWDTVCRDCVFRTYFNQIITAKSATTLVFSFSIGYVRMTKQILNSLYLHHSSLDIAVRVIFIQYGCATNSWNVFHLHHRLFMSNHYIPYPRHESRRPICIPR